MIWQLTSFRGAVVSKVETRTFELNSLSVFPAFYGRSPTRTTGGCVRDALPKIGAFAAAVQEAEDPVNLLPQIYSHRALRTIIFAILYYQVRPFSISW